MTNMLEEKTPSVISSAEKIPAPASDSAVSATETVAGQGQLLSPVPAPEQGNTAPPAYDFSEYEPVPLDIIVAEAIDAALEKARNGDVIEAGKWLARELREIGLEAEDKCGLDACGLLLDFQKAVAEKLGKAYGNSELEAALHEAYPDYKPAQPKPSKRGRPKKPVDKKQELFREALTRATTEDPVKVGTWLVNELKSVGIPPQVAYNTLLDYLTYSQNLNHHKKLDEVFRSAFPGFEPSSQCPIIEIPPGANTDPSHGDFFIDIRDGCVYRLRSLRDGEINVDLVSEGFAFISQEVRDEHGEAIFTIEGRGAVDGHRFKFDISGRDFSDPRKLKAALVAHYGAQNRVLGLKGDVIQSLSLGVVKKRLVKKPCWLDSRLVIPGLDEYSDLKLDISNAIPADVSTADTETGLRALRLMLEAWHEVIMPLVAVFASPLVAKYLPDDRFGLLLTGTSGLMKTEMLRHCMAIFGSGYLRESNIVRFGEGATTNAILKLAADSGCLPFFIDNFKPIKKDDAGRLVSLIHAVLEGSEKRRLNKEAEHREVNEYLTTLLLTGEDLPTEASTLARVLPVPVEHQPNLDKVTELQAISESLPAIGRLWCQYLSSTKLDLAPWRAKRQELVMQAKENGAINPGRIGTTAATLWYVWQIALQSPLGEVLREFNRRFEAELWRLLTNSARLTQESNEAVRFVETLRELIAAGRVWLDEMKSSIGPPVNEKMIGWVHRPGFSVFTDIDYVAIHPDLALEAVRKYAGLEISVSRPTLYRQLDELGYIDVADDGKRLMLTRYKSKVVRVLRFKPGALGFGPAEEAEEPHIVNKPSRKSGSGLPASITYWVEGMGCNAPDP